MSTTNIPYRDLFIHLDPQVGYLIKALSFAPRQGPPNGGITFPGIHVVFSKVIAVAAVEEVE